MRKYTVLMLLLLAGCTVARTNMLDDRTAIISGRGNAFVSIGDVTAKVLQTAALEAQARGYPYFAVLSSQDASSTSYWTSPTQTNGIASGSCYGGNCQGLYSGTTWGGQTYAFNKPGADVAVKFFREGEVDPNAQGVWSVAKVLAANPKK